MTETIHVKSVIGTGDPLDGIALIPLLAQWRVPQGCIGGVIDRQECTKPIRRLYVLEGEFQGHRVVGCCEDHHQRLGPA